MTIYRHSVAVAPTASETETIRILLHIKSKCRLMSTKFKLLVFKVVIEHRSQNRFTFR